jgi:hypothetical protein
MTPKEFDKKWWGLIPDAEMAEWDADIASIDDGWREKIKTESDAREKTVAYLFEQFVNGECRPEILDTYWTDFIKTSQYKSELLEDTP